MCVGTSMKRTICIGLVVFLIHAHLCVGVPVSDKLEQKLSQKLPLTSDTKDAPTYGLPEIQRCKPLHDAAKTGNLAQVKLLVTQGADVNQLGCFWKMTPVQMALFDEKTRTPMEQIALGIAQWKIENKTTILDSFAQVSMDFSGDKEKACTIVEYLLKNGAEKTINNRQEAFENTALHIAALFGHEKVVKPLCLAGIDKNSLNSNGYTPLYVACANKHCKTVKALAEAGVDLNKKMRNTEVKLEDDEQMMAIHMATLQKSIECVKALLDAGQSVDVQNAWGQTPLHYAAMQLDVAMINFLLSRGARKDIKDDCGKDQDGYELCGLTPRGRAAKKLLQENPEMTQDELLAHPIMKLLQYKKD